MSAHLPSVEGSAGAACLLPALEDAKWTRPKSFPFLRGWEYLPVSDSEMLQVAHHLPIAIRIEREVPAVVAIVDEAYHRQAPLDARDRWRPTYMPIALRCLPFHLAGSPERPEEPSEADLEPVPGTDLVGPAGETPVARNGALTAPTRAVFKALCDARAGARRLAKAADQLLLAGGLMVLESPGLDETEAGRATFLTINPKHFDTLSPLRLCAAARESFLPLELAGALLFSQRHLPSQVSTRSEPTAEPVSLYDVAAELDYVIRGVQKVGVNLDNSELFDIKDLG